IANIDFVPRFRALPRPVDRRLCRRCRDIGSAGVHPGGRCSRAAGGGRQDEDAEREVRRSPPILSSSFLHHLAVTWTTLHPCEPPSVFRGFPAFAANCPMSHDEPSTGSCAAEK